MPPDRFARSLKEAFPAERFAAIEIPSPPSKADRFVAVALFAAILSLPFIFFGN